MVKIELTADTPGEMSEFLKNLEIDKFLGSKHQCSCHRDNEELKISEPGSEVHEAPAPTQKTPVHDKNFLRRNGNPETIAEFDRLCKEKGLVLKPEGDRKSKKVCSKCGMPFYGVKSSKICPACKSLPKTPKTPEVSKPVPPPAPAPVQVPKPVTPPPPRLFTHCVKCNTPFNGSQEDAMCPKCRKEQDRINEQLRRDREDQEAAAREKRLQEELESRTKWKICPACGASFLPEDGNFYCKRCTDRALKRKKLKK